MKALVLAAGRGSRLEGCFYLNKCLALVAGKRLIKYSLDNAVKAGVGEIVIVVAWESGSVMYLCGAEHAGVPIRYVVQQPLLGLVHAMECAKASLDGDDFLLMLGDEILCGARHVEMIAAFQDKGLFGICGAVPGQVPDRIRKTYEILADGVRIERLTEKPLAPSEGWMGTGNCVFRSDMLEYVASTPPDLVKGERELAGLVQVAVDDGQRIEVFDLCDAYFNVNSAEDLLEVEEHLRAHPEYLRF